MNGISIAIFQFLNSIKVFFGRRICALNTPTNLWAHFSNRNEWLDGISWGFILIYLQYVVNYTFPYKNFVDPLSKQ